MPLKQIRFNVEFVIDVEDITVETVKENFIHYKNFEEIIKDPKIYIDGNRVRKFLHAFINEDEILRTYIRNNIPHWAENYSKSGLEEVLSISKSFGWEDPLINAVLDRLSPEDKEFFQNAEKKDRLIEALELFFLAFKAKVSDFSSDYIEK